MKRKIITALSLFGLIAASAAIVPNDASALALDTGSPIIAIDGDADANVTVSIFSTAPMSLTYGYFLNGSSTFNAISPFSFTNFQGGDKIDFAIYNPFALKYYTLSGDEADDTYSVSMNFGNEVLTGSPQQPADWSLPYYYNANITWTLTAAVVNTNEFTYNILNSGNDGVAPVPEPATLLLMGSGLLGYALLRRKKNS